LIPTRAIDSIELSSIFWHIPEFDWNGHLSNSGVNMILLRKRSYRFLHLNDSFSERDFQEWLSILENPGLCNFIIYYQIVNVDIKRTMNQRDTYYTFQSSTKFQATHCARDISWFRGNSGVGGWLN